MYDDARPTTLLWPRHIKAVGLEGFEDGWNDTVTVYRAVTDAIQADTSTLVKERQKLAYDAWCALNTYYGISVEIAAKGSNWWQEEVDLIHEIINGKEE